MLENVKSRLVIGDSGTVMAHIEDDSAFLPSSVSAICKAI